MITCRDQMLHTEFSDARWHRHIDQGGVGSRVDLKFEEFPSSVPNEWQNKRHRGIYPTSCLISIKKVSKNKTSVIWESFNIFIVSSMDHQPKGVPTVEWIDTNRQIQNLFAHTWLNSHVINSSTGESGWDVPYVQKVSTFDFLTNSS